MKYLKKLLSSCAVALAMFHGSAYAQLDRGIVMPNDPSLFSVGFGNTLQGTFEQKTTFRSDYSGFLWHNYEFTPLAGEVGVPRLELWQGDKNVDGSKLLGLGKIVQGLTKSGFQYSSTVGAIRYLPGITYTTYFYGGGESIIYAFDDEVYFPTFTTGMQTGIPVPPLMSPVAEPAILWMFCAGLGITGILALRRRSIATLGDPKASLNI